MRVVLNGEIENSSILVNNQHRICITNALGQ